MNKEKNVVSAVIYVHNAQERVGVFLRTVISTMEENFEHSEVICVNDASEDKSLDVIRKESSAFSHTSISVVNMSYYHGVEAAMSAGVDLAIGDFVFEFDNTILDFHKSAVMDAYERALEGYDIVSSSPERKEKFASKVFYRVFDRFAELPYEMRTESFRVLSRRAINRTDSMNKAIPYRKVVYTNCGLKTDRVMYRTMGANMVSPDRKEQEYRVKLAVDSLLLFTEAGSRLSMAMTVLMMIVSVFMIVYSIIVYATSHPVEGWTTTILFLSVVFFGLFGILTVVIKYLQIIVDLVFKRKRYSFEEIEKLTK